MPMALCDAVVMVLAAARTEAMKSSASFVSRVNRQKKKVLSRKALLLNDEIFPFL